MCLELSIRTTIQHIAGMLNFKPVLLNYNFDVGIKKYSKCS